MKFTMVHTNLNVQNLEKSLGFYQKALGLHEVRRKAAADGSFIIVYLADETSGCQLELTWLRNHPQSYNLGDNETHICYRTDDYPSAHALHEQMQCICYENTAMGLYFISDPDGYWFEIVPARP
jgi:lactoylglutathione lyase